MPAPFFLPPHLGYSQYLPNIVVQVDETASAEETPSQMLDNTPYCSHLDFSAKGACKMEEKRTNWLNCKKWETT